jgi:hypothetical protein
MLTMREGEGSGAGLWLSHRLVKARDRERRKWRVAWPATLMKQAKMAHHALP